MAKKKQSSHLAGWIIAGLLGVIAYQSGILSPTLEGRVTERFTTVRAPKQNYVPPEPQVSSR